MNELVTQEAAQQATMLEGQRTTLEGRIREIRITSEIEAQQATDLWAELDARIKEGEAKYQEIDAPLKEARERLKGLFKPTLDAMKDARGALNTMIGAWRAEVKEAARKANQAREDERARQAEHIAVRTGQDVQEIHARIPAPRPVEGPGAGFYTQHGEVTAARVPKWEVTDVALIPWEHQGVCLWSLNEAAVTKLRRSAKEDFSQAPPGIRFYYAETQKRRGA